MLLIDSHCHLDDKVYDRDRAAVIGRAREKLSAIITCAAEPKDFALTFALVKKYPGYVFATAGVHPAAVKDYPDSALEKARLEIAKNRAKIVGVGEIGLDYHWVKDELERRRQRELFDKMLKLGRKLDLPVLVHLRSGLDKEQADAHLDAFEIMEKAGIKRAQLHMFGAKELLPRALSNGWLISTNAICETSKVHKKIIARVPLENLLLETDAPYLVPAAEKLRGIGRNEPAFVTHVCTKVAELKELKAEEVAVATARATRRFFGLRT